MKILLLYPPIWETTGFKTNYNNGVGLLSIGAILRNDGHTVRIMDTEVLGLTHDEILNEINSWKPTHVGISCLSNGMLSAIKLTKLIKEKYPDIWVALGGVGPSAESERAMKESGCDSVTKGEAELVLYKSFGEKGIHVGIPPENLDDFPDPAYDLLEPSVGSSYWGGNLPRPDIANVREIMVMWSRGCPHACTFCSKASIQRGKPRTRSPERIVKELKMLKEKYRVNSIFVYDDELIGMSETHNEWLEDVLCNICSEGLDQLYYKGQGRCSEKFFTEGFAWKLRAAGFFAMMMGCESGSEKVKRRIKKGTTNDDIRSTLKALNGGGVKVYGFWMIGMPEETSKEARETERLIVEMAKYMDWIQVTVFSPLMGSDFWNEAVENGWLKNYDAVKNFQVEPMLDMPWMSRKEISRWQEKLYRIFWSLKQNEREIVCG